MLPPASALDRRALLARARSGDEAALDALFAAELPPLKRWASGRLPRWARDIADTTDLVQDTALDALRRLEDFEDRGEGALQAYLRQAIVNRIRNAVRHRMRRGPTEPLSPSLPTPAASPVEAAIAAQAFERYESGLRQLTPADRAAVVARVELGLAYPELADLLAKPTANAARMAVTRALLRLAELMRQPAPSGDDRRRV
jgi:RNA polymerase sigma factor (sigma-70 family)